MRRLGGRFRRDRRCESEAWVMDRLGLFITPRGIGGCLIRLHHWLDTPYVVK